jgi:hypothetical protein
VSVHWRPASLPDAEVKDRFKVTVPPGDTVLEDNERESVCPKRVEPDKEKNKTAVTTTPRGQEDKKAT